MIQKLIKINFIILVIFSITCNFLHISFADEENFEITVTSIPNEEEQNEEQEDSGDSEMDALELEKSSLQNDIENSNSQIQVINEDMSEAVAEITEINQKIYDKQLEIETLEVQEKGINEYLEVAEEEYEKSREKFNTQKDLLEKRLVTMYELGETSFLDILVNCKSSKSLRLYQTFYQTII